MLVQGVPLRDLLLYWRGVEDANKQAGNDTFPPAIAIGTHVPVGVGFTWGMRLDGTDSIATLYHGEGHPSTSEYRPASTSRARPTRRRYSIKKQRENDGSPIRR
jgi:pyruvate dehydrogenase E1 component alpha subunit